jgi:hypothetical protein
MAPHYEPAPAAARAPPPHRINSWPFICEPTHKIRTRAYPFADLTWTIDPVIDDHHLMKSMDSVHGTVEPVHAFSLEK